ncbi:hypothetical protein CDD81_4695 [Ophiocordyceps australis]|uniref:Uncharacterized protein n=1 Tax=Ophiocordyceps australis TaxID=1399860 RepID=A0A2C5XIY9_9HYPO|nr:hypothetical protein CDD81_4695 [Ophiocordyceps australis]
MRVCSSHVPVPKNTLSKRRYVTTHLSHPIKRTTWTSMAPKCSIIFIWHMLCISALIGVASAGGPVAPPTSAGIFPTWGFLRQVASLKHLETCDSLDRLPRHGPLALARAKNLRLGYSCAEMGSGNENFVPSLECPSDIWGFGRGCTSSTIASDIYNALPADMIATIIRKSGLDAAGFKEMLAKDLFVGDRETRVYQLRWIKEAFDQQRVVCWPRRPGFTPSQFLDIFGYIGGLLVNTSTLEFPVPERYMDYPPGHVNFYKYHVLNHTSFRPARAAGQIKSLLAVRVPPKTVSTLRADVDRWAGLAGRVVFHSLVWSQPYSCPEQNNCQSTPLEDCDKPLAPSNAEEVLEVLAAALLTRLSVVISWPDVIGPRPRGVWITVEGKATSVTHSLFGIRVPTSSS